MSESQDIQHELTTLDSDFHKSRPSLTTNASGLSFNTVTTAEGLSRLSQFPPPPVGVPISPFESSLGLSSNAGSNYLATPPDTPVVFKFRPMPQNGQLGSSAVERSDSSSSGSTLPSFSRNNSRGAFAQRQLPSIPQTSPLRTPPFSAASGSTSRLPAPNDWHDGSSSIGLDQYSDKMLSTQFLTDLLNSDTQAQGDAPPRYKRDPYEPSVISDMLSTESVVTYPPRRAHPETLPRTPEVPAQSSNTSPAFQTVPMSPTMPGTSLLFTPQHSHHLPGRTTPFSDRTYQSDSNTGESYTTSSHPAVVQTATYAQVSAIGVERARSLSLSPSSGSLASSMPLLQQQFPRRDRDAIQEEDTENDYSTGPSTLGVRSKRERRQSTFSSKTTRSYVSSLITRMSHSTGGDRRSFRQPAQWFRRKPLPPVPRIPDISLVQEVETRKAEAALPLPQLVNRAYVLEEMLDKGHRPYQSQSDVRFGSKPELDTVPSDSMAGVENFHQGEVRNSGVAPRRGFMHFTRGRKSRSQDLRNSQWGEPPVASPSKSRAFLFSKKRLWIIAAVVAAVIIIIIAVAVGVTVGKKGHSDPVCSGNLTGADCSLDATCVCTSTSAGQCNQIAQSLVNLVPVLNNRLGGNFSAASLSAAIWQIQGSPRDDCSNQARLIDVAPGLNSTLAPNRTQWAQAAILWDLVKSQNLEDVGQLRDFVVKAPWQSLSSSDGPTSDSASQFTTTVSGFQFNFAAQTVTPPAATFVDVGQPSQGQISRTNDVSHAALDRMYTFATASSTQQKKALSNYWTAVLQQDPDDLSRFLSFVSGAPVMLPFDANFSSGQHTIDDLMTNSSTSPFPPPLACYPGLNSSQMQTVNSFESSAFGLPSASSASQFDVSCFPNRPIYGVLNILRLRLPFVDSRTGVAKQAAILTRDASSRAVIYSGEVLSSLPGEGSSINITSLTTDPRRFGTLNNLNHVVLEYLTSIKDVNVAIALVKFVLSGSAVPPNSNSLMFSALSSLPFIEVAVFGTVEGSDIASTVSAFSTPTGSLFFGTDQSLSVRQWCINAALSSVVWTELAASSEIVRDGSFTDATFNSVWQPAFDFFHFPNNAVVDVSNITSSFRALGKFSPS